MHVFFSMISVWFSFVYFVCLYMFLWFCLFCMSVGMFLWVAKSSECPHTEGLFPTAEKLCSTYISCFFWGVLVLVFALFFFCFCFFFNFLIFNFYFAKVFEEAPFFPACRIRASKQMEQTQVLTNDFISLKTGHRIHLRDLCL